MNNYAEIKKSIKKCESNIVITGLGVLVFGFWAVLKFIIQTLYGDNGIGYELAEIRKSMDVSTEMMSVIVFFYLAVVSVVILACHCYVGFKAIGYGRGLKKKWGFLIFAGFLAVMTAWGIPFYFIPKDGTFTMDDTVIAAALVDITLLYIFLDMIISAIRLNYFKKIIEREQ